MFPIIDQGVHTHSCHHAHTWPSGLHGHEVKVVTWQCKATTWHERASSLLERSLWPLFASEKCSLVIMMPDTKQPCELQGAL